jgi:ATP-binding cassette subfamily B multidrug efflux pump
LSILLNNPGRAVLKMKHIRKLLHFVKPYWKLALIALILLTTLVFTDLAIPLLIERIIDQGIKQKNLTLVIQTSVLMLGISLLNTLIAIGNNKYSILVGEGVGRDLREAIFTKIQSFSFGNLDEFSTGKLIVRLTSDVDAVKRLVQISLRIGTRAPLLMIGSIILMFKTDPHLALFMIPLLFITMGVIVFFSVAMVPLFRTVQQKLDRLNTVLQENIAGARLVKAFVRADFEGERFEIANEDYTQNSVRLMQFMSVMSPTLTFFVNIGIVTVIWYGGLQVIQGNLTVGQIVAFTNYLFTTMTPLLLMTMLSNIWANGIASARRVNEVLDTVAEVQEDPHAQPLPDQALARVVFNNVSFHYNGDVERPVLENVNMVAEPGQTIAILGATGAGKSSLINLIPRFYDVTEGQILINGMDIRCIQTDSLLSMIGTVPQESILFSGTVSDNIRYGRPEATQEEVMAAAQAAQAHDFIMKLPQGYETHVEERGANLSGGQKQRIAIARALITQPKILILDDSTSAVDIETETKIQSALQQNLHHRTSFVVAQRISTVLNADKILVIDKGQIAAQGTHAQLIKSSPIYQEIYDSQLGNGIHVQ